MRRLILQITAADLAESRVSAILYVWSVSCVLVNDFAVVEGLGCTY